VREIEPDDQMKDMLARMDSGEDGQDFDVSVLIRVLQFVAEYCSVKEVF